MKRPNRTTGKQGTPCAKCSQPILHNHGDICYACYHEFEAYRAEHCTLTRDQAEKQWRLGWAKVRG